MKLTGEGYLDIDNFTTSDWVEVKKIVKHRRIVIYSVVFGIVSLLNVLMFFLPYSSGYIASGLSQPSLRESIVELLILNLMGSIPLMGLLGFFNCTVLNPHWYTVGPSD